MQQVPMFTPDCAWVPPNLNELPSWANAQRVAVDVETKDPDLFDLGPGVRRDDSYMVGVSFAIEGGPKHYLPFAHNLTEDNLDRDACFRYLRDQAKHFKGEIVGANLGYDLDYLAEEEIEFNAASWFRDVQISAPLINELHMSYSLENILIRAGIPGKSEEVFLNAIAAFGLDVKHPKRDLWRLPGRYVGEYAERDVTAPLEVLRIHEKEIERQGLQDMFDLESKVLPALLRMRRRGVKIDFDRIEMNEVRFGSRINETLAKVKDATGFQLTAEDITVTGAVAPVLEHIGIKVPTTDKGNPSIKKEWLASYEHVPLVALILKARGFHKARRDYVTRIRDFETNGRIHATYNQMRNTAEDGSTKGAAFGRLSCQNPNLTQVPARDPEIGPYVRMQYLPEDGEQWYSADFSQQEPRFTFHFAEQMGLPGAHELCEEYRRNPDTDSHQMMADLTKLARDPAKQVFLACVYSMGGAKLCGTLKLPTRFKLIVVNPDTRQSFDRYRDTYAEARELSQRIKQQGFNVIRMFLTAGEEGQAILDQFHAAVPFVKELARRVEKIADRDGFIVTEGGRICRFPPEDVGAGYMFTHKALNRKVQGSAAIQTKIALVHADEERIPLQLQIHDELTLSSGGTSIPYRLRDIMVESLQISVPTKVDLEYGPNWGEAKNAV